MTSVGLEELGADTLHVRCLVCTSAQIEEIILRVREIDEADVGSPIKAQPFAHSIVELCAITRKDFVPGLIVVRLDDIMYMK